MLAIFVLVAALHPTKADETNSAATLQPIVRAQLFEFTSASASPTSKETTFCLPRGEQLIRVLSANVANSNARAEVNVKGDIEANCIILNVVVPPATDICTDVPAPRWDRPSNTRKLCTSVASRIALNVQYESKNVDINAIPSTNPSSQR